MSRFPFPVPYGWFAVGWSSDVAPGDVVPRYYFARDLVLWRDHDGNPHLQEALCPHLGAHLGHGGHVEGCNLQCPFHGWQFDGDGTNVLVPYSDRVNKQAHLETFPIIERNGLIMVWYHPEGADPMWEIPEVPEFADPEQFSEPVGRIFDIPTAWQEIAENQVDVAHFRYVHNTDQVPEFADYWTEGPISYMRSTQRFPTPRGVVDGRIDVDTHGPGFGIVRFSGIVDTVLLGCNVPVTADECQLRFTFTVRKLGDEATTSAVGEAFVEEVSRQVVEDIPIWAHKGHLRKPALIDTDGPYLQFRKWAAQFYAEGIGDGQQVYAPGRPDTGTPEAEGVHKHTASARLKDEDEHRANMTVS